MLLRNYRNFLDRVNAIGFMTLSNILPGLPSLTEETPRENWYTGDLETDPWCWKDRAAEEKQLAFGCILGGHKGFVSSNIYPLFYIAFCPTEHMEERREAGEISKEVWDLWKLFEKKNVLDTSDIRQEFDVTRKKGGSKIDKAIIELQQCYYITVAGNRRKLNKFGQPFGWPANVYEKVENWAPAEWLKQNQGYDASEARDKILEKGISISKGISRADLAKVLGLKMI